MNAAQQIKSILAAMGARPEIIPGPGGPVIRVNAPAINSNDKKQ